MNETKKEDALSTVATNSLENAPSFDSTNTSIPQRELYDDCSSLGEYLKKNYNLQPVGRQTYRINPCPKCNGNDHFTYYEHTDSFYSFNDCCTGGGFKQFLRQIEGIDTNVQSKPQSNLNVANTKINQPLDLTKIVEEYACYHPYFKKRGISEAIATKYKLGFLEGGFNNLLTTSFNTFGRNVFHEEYKKAYLQYRFMLPITEADGTIKYIITRADEQFAEENGLEVKQKTHNLKDFNVQLFNERYIIDDSLSDEDIYVVEGIFDALSIEELGHHAIALNSTANLNLLYKLIEQYKPMNKRFILIPDNDEAGANLKEKFIAACQKRKLSYSIVEIPTKYKDVNDMLTADKKQLQQVINSVLPVPEQTLVQSPDKYLDDNHKVKVYELAMDIVKHVPIINLETIQAYFDIENGVWRTDFSHKMSTLIFDRLKNHSTTHYQREIISMIRNHTYKSNKELFLGFNSKKNVVTFQNGTYYFADRNNNSYYTNHFNAEDMSTIYVPHNIPGTNLEEPTKTKAFLKQILEHDEEIQFIFEWLGYCLYKDLPIHSFLLLHGPGGNGKSTLIKLFERVLGAHNISNIPLDKLVENRFAGAQLENKLLNACADIKSGFFEHIEAVKEITGDDSLFVEKKGKDGYTMKTFVKLMFSCNVLPTFKERSEAVEERIIILPMIKKPVWNINLADVLNDQEEIERIIAYAISAFERVLLGRNHSLRSEAFTLSERMKKAKALWLLDSNNVHEFFTECCHDRRGERGINELASKVYREYQYFCTDNGMKAMSHKKFALELERLYGIEKKSDSSQGGKNVYRGIKLKR